MHAPIGVRRIPQRSRLFTVVAFVTLAVTLLGPLGQPLALAQADTQAPPAEEAGIPEVEPSPTPPPPVAEIPEDEPSPTPPPPVAEIPDATEVPQDNDHGEDPAAATEMPTAAAITETSTLTISVYRCNHPEFDTGLSSNFQAVIDTCTEPGFGTFDIFSTIEAPSQSGQELTFEVGQRPEIQEFLQPGYDNPVADCFLYGPDGTLVDRIGPGEAGGGQWPVGRSFGTTHCDWYQVDRGLGAVYVVNMACPSTAALFPAPSMTDLVAICTEPAGQKQFFVVHGAGLERMVPSGGEFNDALFEAIQTGPIEIWMDDPAGFDTARVFCQVTTLEGAEISPFAEVSVGSFRATGMTLVAGQRLHCSWFNIESGMLDPGDNPTPTREPVLDPGDNPTPTQEPVLDPGTRSELRIVKHTCLAGYVPTLQQADPVTDCPGGPNGIVVTLSGTDPATSDVLMVGLTGDSMADPTVFGGIPGGQYTIAETVPPGTSAIFVLGCGGGGGIDPIPQFIDGTLAINLPPGVVLTCHWFNISEGPGIEDPGSSPPTITPPEDLSTLIIQHHTCPAGYDPMGNGNHPINDCPVGPDGVAFTLEDEDPGTQNLQAVTGNPVPGEVRFSGLVPGMYIASTALPEEAETIFFIGCQENAANSIVPDIIIGLFISLEPGTTRTCHWFIVPEAGQSAARTQGTNGITIATQARAPGLAVSTVDAEPQTLHLAAPIGRLSPLVRERRPG